MKTISSCGTADENNFIMRNRGGAVLLRECSTPALAEALVRAARLYDLLEKCQECPPLFFGEEAAQEYVQSLEI